MTTFGKPFSQALAYHRASDNARVLLATEFPERYLELYEKECKIAGLPYPPEIKEEEDRDGR